MQIAIPTYSRWLQLLKSRPNLIRNAGVTGSSPVGGTIPLVSNAEICLPKGHKPWSARGYGLGRFRLGSPSNRRCLCWCAVMRRPVVERLTSMRSTWLSDVKTQDLEHRAASNLVNAGSPQRRGEGAGTSSDASERYAHLNADALLEAVNAASQLTGTTWSNAEA